MRNKTSNMNVIYIFLGVIIVIICISILLRIHVLNNPYRINTKLSPRERLNQDGVVLLNDFLSIENIRQIKNFIKNDEIIKAKQHIIESHREPIQNILGKDYEFNDYIFLIKKSQFHTCHRDYNGDFFNQEQQFPSYTIIIYLEDMGKCLDVIHKSHSNKGEFDFNITDYSQTIQCKHGDAILFNSNLIHNGSLNDNENHARIQMKISHKRDMKVLDFYNQYNKVLNSENNTPVAIKHIQKHVSCQFPFVSSYLKQYDNNKSNSSSSLCSSLFANLETIQP